jgi:predicted RNA methylase
MGVYSSVDYHRTMNFDGVRNPAYERAIRDAVTPKSVVLDLGAGLGMLGFLAARAGARKVYLVEPEPVIEVTRKVAEANGLENVECIQATAETLELAEKADLILSVFTGNFLLTEDLLPSLFYARDHFLAPNGRLLPDRGRMMVAPVSVPAYYQKNVENWSLEQASAHGVESYGIDYQVVRPYMANSMFYDSAKNFDAQLLASPADLIEMDFMTATRAECDGSVDSVFQESGECERWLSTAPDAKSTHWRQVFMPLERPIAAESGQKLGFSLKRPEYGEWTWTTDFDGRQQRQSTFLSGPMSPELLRRKSDAYQPELNEKGRAAQYVLAQMDGSASTEGLADAVLEHFGDSFTSREDALRFVKSLVNKFA